MGKFCPLRVLRILSALTLSLSTFALGDDSCFTAPVSVNQWNWAGLVYSPEFLGEWRLNVSPENSTMTRVQARVQLSRSGPGSDWWLEAFFDYPAHPNFGLPYNLQRVRFQFEMSDGVHQAEVDWTRACSVVGRSLFPGQKISSRMPLPGTATLSGLEKPLLIIWGSEN